MKKWMRKEIRLDGPDLNIMPVLDILSTLVVFLLMTAVWFQAGRFEASGVSQQIANQPVPKEIHLFIEFIHPGVTKVYFTNSVAGASKQVGRVRLTDLKEYLADMLRQKNLSVQNISQTHLQPIKIIPYREVIQVMDILSGLGLKTVSLQRGS